MEVLKFIVKLWLLIALCAMVSAASGGVLAIPALIILIWYWYGLPKRRDRIPPAPLPTKRRLTARNLSHRRLPLPPIRSAGIVERRIPWTVSTVSPAVINCKDRAG